MIKKLLFSAALLAPGVASAGTPSATLPGQIVPAGSVPAPAAAAGFTTTVLDYDFSQPFYANTANWLDCAGATTPQWWYAWVGFGAGPWGAPCSAISQATDPSSGLPALHMIWQDSYYNTTGK